MNYSNENSEQSKNRRDRMISFLQIHPMLKLTISDKLDIINLSNQEQFKYYNFYSILKMVVDKIKSHYIFGTNSIHDALIGYSNVINGLN